jgi:hypothetical protein
MGRPRGVDHGAHPALESRGIEALGVRVQRIRIHAQGTGLDAHDRGLQRLDRLLAEQTTGDAVDHGFQGATAPERNYRRASGHRLDRHEAEILDAWEHQRAACLLALSDHRERLAAEQAHVAARNAAA